MNIRTTALEFRTESLGRQKLSVSVTEAANRRLQDATVCQQVAEAIGQGGGVGSHERGLLVLPPPLYPLVAGGDQVGIATYNEVSRLHPDISWTEWDGVVRDRSLQGSAQANMVAGIKTSSKFNPADLSAVPFSGITIISPLSMVKGEARDLFVWLQSETQCEFGQNLASTGEDCIHTTIADLHYAERFERYFAPDLKSFVGNIGSAFDNLPKHGGPLELRIAGVCCPSEHPVLLGLFFNLSQKDYAYLAEWRQALYGHQALNDLVVCEHAFKGWFTLGYWANKPEDPIFISHLNSWLRKTNDRISEMGPISIDLDRFAVTLFDTMLSFHQGNCEGLTLPEFSVM